MPGRRRALCANPHCREALRRNGECPNQLCEFFCSQQPAPQPKAQLQFETATTHTSPCRSTIEAMSRCQALPVGCASCGERLRRDGSCPSAVCSSNLRCEELSGRHNDVAPVASFPRRVIGAVVSLFNDQAEAIRQAAEARAEVRRAEVRRAEERAESGRRLKADDDRRTKEKAEFIRRAEAVRQEIADDELRSRGHLQTLAHEQLFAMQSVSALPRPPKAEMYHQPQELPWSREDLEARVFVSDAPAVVTPVFDLSGFPSVTLASVLPPSCLQGNKDETHYLTHFHSHSIFCPPLASITVELRRSLPPLAIAVSIQADESAILKQQLIDVVQLRQICCESWPQFVQFLLIRFAIYSEHHFMFPLISYINLAVQQRALPNTAALWKMSLMINPKAVKSPSSPSIHSSDHRANETKLSVSDIPEEVSGNRPAAATSSHIPCILSTDSGSDPADSDDESSGDELLGAGGESAGHPSAADARPSIRVRLCSSTISKPFSARLGNIFASASRGDKITCVTFWPDALKQFSDRESWSGKVKDVGKDHLIVEWEGLPAERSCFVFPPPQEVCIVSEVHLFTKGGVVSSLADDKELTLDDIARIPDRTKNILEVRNSWYNDWVMDNFCRVLSVGANRRCMNLSALWYKKLCDSKQPSSLLKKKTISDLKEAEIICIPMCFPVSSQGAANHWGLTCVLPRHSIAISYDSMCCMKQRQVDPILSFFAEITGRKFSWKVRRHPQQRNSYDCGPMALAWAYAQVFNVEAAFTQEDMQSARKWITKVIADNALSPPPWLSNFDSAHPDGDRSFRNSRVTCRAAVSETGRIGAWTPASDVLAKTPFWGLHTLTPQYVSDLKRIWKICQDHSSKDPLIDVVLSALKQMSNENQWSAEYHKKNIILARGLFLRLDQLLSMTPIDLSESSSYRDSLRQLLKVSRAEVAKKRRVFIKPQQAMQMCKVIADNEELLAMFLIIWTHAGRPSNVAALTRSEVRLDGTLLTIVWSNAKTVATRGPFTTFSKMPASCATFLERWLHGRDEILWSEASRPLLLKKLRMSLRLVVPLADLRALRRGSLIALSESQMTLQELMNFSGHKSEESLKRYLGWGAFNARHKQLALAHSHLLLGQ